MKYIIEIENEPFGRNDDPVIPHGMDELYRAKGFKSLVFDKNGLDKLIPYTEPDHKAIEDEVWELADYMGRMSLTERDLCFGFPLPQEVTMNLSYQEAKAKFEAWLKQKDEIHVGDEVIPIDFNYDTVIVTRIWRDDHSRDCLDTLGPDGSICSFLTSNVKKTGRHFPEVAELFQKMRGEEE